MSERRYDDREVGLILKRVAELHESEVEQADVRAMTHAELEQVVQELGISKDLVARATRELAVPDVNDRPVWWLGSKTNLVFEDVVAGDIDDAALTPMLEVLRRTLGEPGALRHEAGVRNWSTTSDASRRVSLTVIEQGGRTTLRLEERLPGEAGVVVVASAVLGGFLGFFMTMSLHGLAAGAVLMLLMGLLILGGALVGGMGARAIWQRHSAKREAQLRRAFGAIVELALPPTRPEPS